MRMSLTTDDNKPILLQRTEDGGNNSLYINGEKIPPSQWVQGVNGAWFTITCGNATYRFLKASQNVGNLTLRVVDDYTYAIEPARQATGAAYLTLNQVYPVGAIFISAVQIDIEALFPGTVWARINGRFLLGDGGGYLAGETGGEATHRLSTSEMPSHNHSGSCNNHTHTVSMDSHTHGIPTGRHWHRVFIPYHNHTVTLSGGKHAHYEQSGRIFLTGSVNDDYKMKTIKAGSGTSHRVLTTDNGSGGVSEVQATAMSEITISGETDMYDGADVSSGFDEGGPTETYGASPSASASYSQPGLSINYTGGSEAHNNMPPYLVCCIWKRIS